jgi:hypothetical protein
MDHPQLSHETSSNMRGSQSVHTDTANLYTQNIDFTVLSSAGQAALHLPQHG